MESSTRKYWRARLTAVLKDPYDFKGHYGEDGRIEAWLDDWMQTPELSLAELADSNPDYRLAVVDAQIFYPADYAASSLASLLHRNGWYSVVKMEGK